MFNIDIVFDFPESLVCVKRPPLGSEISLDDTL